MENNATTTTYKPLTKEEIIISNSNFLDIVGLKIEAGDIIYLFNDKQKEKKWSVERVEDINGKLFARFDKYLGPVYTALESVPCNHIMVIKNKDGMQIFHTDELFFNFKEAQNS